jgi:hypothetical protein
LNAIFAAILQKRSQLENYAVKLSIIAGQY